MEIIIKYAVGHLMVTQVVVHYFTFGIRGSQILEAAEHLKYCSTKLLLLIRTPSMRTRITTIHFFLNTVCFRVIPIG